MRLFGRRPLTSLGQDRRGAAAVEFALVCPVLFVVLFGIIKFGIAFNQSLALTDGVRSASRQLAIGRFKAATAYTDTQNSFYTSAPVLSQKVVTLRMFVNGNECTDNTTCQGFLTASSAQGAPALLKASYPCNLVVMGVNFAPGCYFHSQTTERVE